MTVSEFRPGDSVLGFYLLSDASQKTTSAGKPFLTMVLSDCTGSIDCKVWDYTGPIGASDVGKIIKISGTVGEYRGVPQITADRLRLAAEDDSYDLAAIVPTAPIDRADAMSGVCDMLDSIEDADYRAVCLEMLDRVKDKFAEIPAAKSVHHAFIGGLLMHTWNMMRTAHFLSGLYAETVDRSLLIAGAFLHDLGKRSEFEFSELGLVTDYSVRGELVGHLVIGAMEVREVCAKLGVPEEKTTLLEHMVLSHHGQPEFGAAVTCRCAESELLSYIDMIDSRMEIYSETLAGVETGEFSDRVFALDGKRLFNHGPLPGTE